MMENRAGYAHEEWSLALVGYGDGFVDVATEPNHLWELFVINGLGAQHIAVVDANGKVEVAVFFHDFPKGGAEKGGSP